MRVPLFNPSGDDKAELQTMVGGNGTGIANLNESRYKWANGLYAKMRENFWIQQNVSMAPDKATIKLLTDKEMEAHLDTLGFLVALDSFAVANLPNIMHYISASNVRMCLAEQTSQEALHTQAYQYIGEETLTKEQRKTIFERWQHNPLLEKRIKFLQEIGDRFIDDDSLENFVYVCAANYALESIFFYQGFNFYDQLASRKLLVQTQKEISYIRRDELTHVHIFKNIIKAIREEVNIDVDAIVLDVLTEAAKQEIEWGQYIYGNEILGINNKTVEDYVYYIVNKRLKELGIPTEFPERENPYKHLNELQSVDGKNRKENFFETTVTSYDRSETLGGFDDF